MKNKRAVIYCLCNEAGEACKTCPQGLRIKPDHIFQLDKWTWKGKIKK